MKFLKTASSIAIFASAGFASQASAQSAGCAAVNGYSAALLNVRVSQMLTNSALSEGEVITLTASSVTAGASAGDPVWAFADSSDTGTFGGGAFSPSYSVSVTPVSETVSVPIGGILGFGLTEFGPIVTDLHDVQITCSVGTNFNAISKSATALSQTNSAHQQQSLRYALDQNTRSRLQRPNGAGMTVSRSNVFFSTRNMQEQPTDANLWFSFSGRAYFDGYEGYSADYTTGIDWLVGTSSLIGLMAGTGVTNLKNAPISDSESSYFMLGAYGAHAFANGLQLDGYLAHAKAEYDVGATEFDTDRTMTGLSLKNEMAISSGALQIRASLSGSWEDFPAGVAGVTGATSKQYRATAGARHDWNSQLAGTALTPWASMDLEYGYQEDTNSISDDFVSPRVAFGLNGFVGAAVVNASIDLGQTTSDVYDAGINLSYDFKF